MSTKTTVILAIVAGTLLFLASLSHGAIVDGEYATVVRGDTLAKISKQVYGTHKKWPLIKELNGLESDVIHVGQKLRVVDLPLGDKRAVALDTAWGYMKARFKHRRGQVFSTQLTRAGALEELEFLKDKIPTYQVRDLFNRTLAKLEWVDMLEIKDALEENIKEPWHILAMTALIAQESGFRNVPGSHSELGPCQIKPSTAVWLLKDDFQIETVEDAEYNLDIPYINVAMSYQILIDLGLTDKVESLLLALKKYNAGSQKDRYADQIVGRFDRLNKIYKEDILELAKFDAIH